jgi:hypothetical protein
MLTKYLRLFSFAASLCVLCCSCDSEKKFACAEDTMVRFKQRDSSLISPLTKRFLDSLVRDHIRPYFASFEDKDFLINISTNAVTAFAARRFDTVELVRNIPLKRGEFVFKTNSGYGIYSATKGKLYIYRNLFDYITDSVNLEMTIDSANNYIINPRQAKYIDKRGYEGFLFNYGVTAKKNINYLDEHIFQYQKNGRFNKIGRYPKGYVKKYREVRDAYYCLDSSGNVFYTLAYADSIYKLNLDGKYESSAVIVSCRQFNDYEEKDETNLAYKRKYLATSEQNLAVEIVNKKYIVTLRRKQAMDLKAIPEYYLAVFDLDLKRLHLDHFKANITPAIFSNGNTIFFLATDFSKIYEFVID